MPKMARFAKLLDPFFFGSVDGSVLVLGVSVLSSSLSVDEKEAEEEAAAAAILVVLRVVGRRRVAELERGMGDDGEIFRTWCNGARASVWYDLSDV